MRICYGQRVYFINYLSGGPNKLMQQLDKNYVSTTRDGLKVVLIAK